MSRADNKSIYEILYECNNRLAKENKHIIKTDDRFKAIIEDILGGEVSRKVWEVSFLATSLYNYYHDNTCLKTIQDLMAENERLKKLLQAVNKQRIQQAKVACGEKIAYKHQIKTRDVKDLQAQGKSIRDIAKILNTSKSTIHRRLAE